MITKCFRNTLTLSGALFGFQMQCLYEFRGSEVGSESEYHWFLTFQSIRVYLEAEIVYLATVKFSFHSDYKDLYPSFH